MTAQQGVVFAVAMHDYETILARRGCSAGLVQEVKLCALQAGATNSPATPSRQRSDIKSKRSSNTNRNNRNATTQAPQHRHQQRHNNDNGKRNCDSSHDSKSHKNFNGGGGLTALDDGAAQPPTAGVAHTSSHIWARSRASIKLLSRRALYARSASAPCAASAAPPSSAACIAPPSSKGDASRGVHCGSAASLLPAADAAQARGAADDFADDSLHFFAAACSHAPLVAIAPPQPQPPIAASQYGATAASSVTGPDPAAPAPPRSPGAPPSSIEPSPTRTTLHTE